ncbi:MAG: HlyD family efflux transporter periplasmic adaptor subunit, partial [Acaryochloridaceae cyanobacterium RU_4_10]|nr:HlyD family efflux transporter periplasmic adaptor subunit [Acaryochloridaceae cyanobacterium RU_4_10]
TWEWMIGGAIALTLGIVGLGVAQLNKRPTPPPTQSKKSPLQPGKVTALGRIEPAGEVIKVGGPSGERIDKLLVNEGQYVAAGQTIAILESHGERLADLEVAQSQLKDGLAQLDSAKKYGSAQISEARSRKLQAAEPKSKELAAQKATIARLNSELTFAKDDLDRYRQLQVSGAISKRELESKQLAYQTKVEEVQEARAQLAKLAEEQRTNLRNVDAQVRSAQADSARSQAQIQIETAHSSIKQAQAKLDRTIIRAPKPGQILKILLKEGESLEVSTGSGSSGGQGIVEMGNTKQMDVVAEIYETNVGRVRVGQTATITSSAFPGQIKGRVSQIGLKIGKMMSSVLTLLPILMFAS